MSTARWASGLLILTGLMGLAACGEAPQEVVAGQKRADPPAWQAESTAFTAPGWQARDQASWERQIRNRNQGQNEYARIAQ